MTAAAEATAPPATPRRTTMLALPIAAFLVVTAETLPVGLLGDIARDLDARQTSVGMLVGWYALVAAVTPVPIVRLTARYDRRVVLAAMLATFAAANLAAALAPNLVALFAARSVAAATHGGFFAIAAPVLVRLAPPDRKGRAAGSLAVGAISALVLGVPLTTGLGQWAGWRVPTLVVAALGALLATACLRLLPRLRDESRHAARSGEVRVVLRSRALLVLLALTVTLVVAQFNAWTYIEPFLREQVGMSGGGVTRTLALFGAAAVLGSVLGGRVGDSAPRAGFLIGVPVLLVALLAVQATSSSPVLVLPAIAVWAATFSTLAVCTQLAVLRCADAGPAAETASALHGVLFQAGITSGSAVASVLVELGLLGALPVASAAITAIAVALSLGFRRKLVPASPGCLVTG